MIKHAYAVPEERNNLICKFIKYVGTVCIVHVCLKSILLLDDYSFVLSVGTY